ncbi:protein usf-like protein [Corchorus olitorius]|uniref:Protein usf-like protein n=1 Tax=Corchorus olitorius TaxID=93759 RepID=A0A1R3G576_9ROSI|nr:protein usf-like protein [Corchorus olitorius]
MLGSSLVFFETTPLKPSSQYHPKTLKKLSDLVTSPSNELKVQRAQGRFSVFLLGEKREPEIVECVWEVFGYRRAMEKFSVEDVCVRFFCVGVCGW